MTLFDPAWFDMTVADGVRLFLCCLGCYLGLIVLVRINGLRTFSKMSSFDFVVTLAIGSIFATTALSAKVSLGQGVFCVAVLILMQGAMAILRVVFPTVQGMSDNTPLLLMDGPKLLEGNLKKGRITPDDLRAKLREANVTSLQNVLAVVLETTGDVSVLHSGDSRCGLAPELLEGVQR